MGKNGKGIHIRVHGKSWEKMKTKLKDLSSRRSVQSIRPSLEKIKEYMRGWLNYYGIAEMKKRIEEPNKWLYHRIRMCIWKQWKKPKTKVKNLLKPPCTERYARWWCAMQGTRKMKVGPSAGIEQASLSNHSNAAMIQVMVVSD